MERYATLDFCSLFVTYCGKKSPKISKNEIKQNALKWRNTSNYSKQHKLQKVLWVSSNPLCSTNTKGFK